MNDEEPLELPDVQLAAIRDGVVSDSTRSSYIVEIYKFMVWLKSNEPHCLTRDANEILERVRAPEAVDGRLFVRNRNEFEAALRVADTVPLIVEDVITPEIYIDYCRSLRHTRNRTMLSRSAYGVKRSALFHLYRLHNGNGYSDVFRMKLSNYFRGFFRVLTQRRRERAVAAANDPQAVDGNNEAVVGTARVTTTIATFSE
jgi:hypothetical protein